MPNFRYNAIFIYLKNLPTFLQQNPGIGESTFVKQSEPAVLFLFPDL